MAKKQTDPSLKLVNILKPDYQMPSDYNDLVKVYKKMAHDADRRLLRLEEASKMENMKVASRWAYARAMHDIKQWSGEGAKRWETKPPKTVAGLEAKIQDLRTFLLAESSTVKGTKAILKRRAANWVKTVKGEGIDVDFTWSELGTYMESTLHDKLAAQYGSKTALKVIGKIQKIGKDGIKSVKDLRKKIKEANEKDVKEPDPDMTDTLVKQAVSKYGKDVYNTLFK